MRCQKDGSVRLSRSAGKKDGAAPVRLGGVEADLDTGGEEEALCFWFRNWIAAKGFEEGVAEVAERAEGMFDGSLPLAVAFEHLAEEMCDLEKEVEVLGGAGPLGVGVLHLKSPVLLRAKTFVLNAPALSPSFLSQLVAEAGRELNNPHVTENV